MCAATPGGRPQPEALTTSEELGEALRSLAVQAEMSMRDIEREVGKLAGVSLPRSSISDMYNHGLVSRDRLIAFLAALGMSSDTRAWLDALERVAANARRATRRARTAGSCDPRTLGVHASIDSAGTQGLPAYIERDIDVKLDELLTRIKSPRFILIVGGSSVGKTRTAYEAIKRNLSEWTVFHPGTSADIGEFASNPSGRTIIWLDEIQRYMRDRPGLTGSMIRTLYRSELPILLMGTVWPDIYHRALTLEPEGFGDDTRSNDRDVFRSADIVDVGAKLNELEMNRARALAPTDRRIAHALTVEDYGVIQVLSAAPMLMRTWDNCQQIIGVDLVSAVIDLRRVGIEAPLDRSLLQAAGEAYLSPRQLADLPDSWIEAAISYCSGRLDGNVRAMPIVRTGDKISYDLADYLRHEGRRIRRRTPIPSELWGVLAEHVGTGADLERAARSAESRAMYGVAHRLYQLAADRGAPHALVGQGVMLARLHSYASLEALASAGNERAREWLAEILEAHGDVERLERLVLQGVDEAQLSLLYLLENNRDFDRLTSWMKRGLPQAEVSIALARAHDGDMTVLLGLWKSGKYSPEDEFFQLLAECGEEELLRDLEAAGNREATWGLAILLSGAERIEELTERAVGGDEAAKNGLFVYYARQRDSEGLRFVSSIADQDMISAIRKRIDEIESEAALAKLQSGDRSVIPLLPATAFAEQLLQHSIVPHFAREIAEGVLAGDASSANFLTYLLRISKLSLAADRGVLNAEIELTKIARMMGDERTLWEELEAGNRAALDGLVECLSRSGKALDSENLARFGMDSSGNIAAAPTWPS